MVSRIFEYPLNKTPKNYAGQKYSSKKQQVEYILHQLLLQFLVYQNTALFYSHLSAPLATDVTTQLFSIIWWFRPWKPCIFWMHLNVADQTSIFTRETKMLKKSSSTQLKNKSVATICKICEQFVCHDYLQNYPQL